MALYIDFTYLIFCGLKLNIRREEIERKERKGKERKGGSRSKGVRQINFRKYLISVYRKTNQF